MSLHRKSRSSPEFLVLSEDRQKLFQLQRQGQVGSWNLMVDGSSACEGPTAGASYILKVVRCHSTEGPPQLDGLPTRDCSQVACFAGRSLTS